MKHMHHSLVVTLPVTKTLLKKKSEQKLRNNNHQQYFISFFIRMQTNKRFSNSFIGTNGINHIKRGWRESDILCELYNPPGGNSHSDSSLYGPTAIASYFFCTPPASAKKITPFSVPCLRLFASSECLQGSTTLYRTRE